MSPVVDINECDINNGGCAQNCENNDGGYACSCDDGYEVNCDMHNCTGKIKCLIFHWYYILPWVAVS